jgi:ribonuclease BN (tRNA processing enzyme)
MTPLTIGEIASKAKVGSLILSHRMLRTLGKEKETKKEIRNICNLKCDNTELRKI